MISDLYVNQLNMCSTVGCCLERHDSGSKLVVKLNPVLRNW